MISACITTRNEENNIGGLLDNINTLVGEIIIVDGESTDNTVNICRRYTDKIYIRPPAGYCEHDRQFSIEKATGDWVLVMDADERLSYELQKNIISLTKDGSVNGYMFPRRNCKPSGGYYKHIFYPDHQIRLFRRNSGFWPDDIHCQPVIYGNIKKTCDNSHIIHGSPIFSKPGMYDKYARIQAAKSVRSKRYPVWAACAHSYFKGIIEGLADSCFLDGIPGIIGMMNRAYYYSLVTKYARIQNEHCKKC
jgi:glycosyltransferase involved in cell wall biosynthesis